MYVRVTRIKTNLGLYKIQNYKTDAWSVKCLTVWCVYVCVNVPNRHQRNSDYEKNDLFLISSRPDSPD